MGGFIDPEAPLRRRVDRLDEIIDVLLPTLDRSVLSPEARTRLEEIDRKFGAVPEHVPGSYALPRVVS